MSQREIAYASFKDALFQEKLVPGQFVTQKELCELLSVSISPMRDALKDLEGENLVEVLAQTGLRIAHVDKIFIKEAFQMRRFIEIGAVRHVAQSENLDFLRDVKDKTTSILKRAESSIDRDLLSEAQEVDMLMHFELIRALDNSMLTDSHSRIYERIRLIRLNGRYIPSRLEGALNEHLAVINACLDGDADRAANQLEHHFNVAENRALGNGEVVL